MANTLVQGFLRGSTFSVRVAGYATALADMSGGVSQGSALGPTLVLMFINDLSKSICNQCYLFAGDVKVAGIDLKEDMKAIKAWSRKWALPINSAKHQSLTSTEEHRRNELGDIMIVSQAKDQGETLGAISNPLNSV